MADPVVLLGTSGMGSWKREVIATGEQVDALRPDPAGYSMTEPMGRGCSQ